ncbi:MAG: ABC transporter substrate-binding protein [Burkholderiales bacterium]
MLKRLAKVVTTMLVAGFAAGAMAQAQAPDALVKQVSSEVLESVKTDKAIQAGDQKRILALVDAKIVPNVDMARMADEALGRYKSQATPEQKKRLQDEYKKLLVYTYAKAFAQAKDKTLAFKRLRAEDGANEVTVKSEIRSSGGEPVKLDYMLVKTPEGWKIYDLDVGGVVISLLFKQQFEGEVAAKGVEGLIKSLTERNKTLSAKG